MTIGSALKVFSASLGALICSFVIAMAISRYVPQTLGNDGTTRADPGRIYTHEELERAEKDMLARLEDLRRLDQEKTFGALLRELKIHALWGVWLPWFLFPVFVRIKNLLYFAVAMSVPVAAASMKLLPLEELLVTTVALTAGILVKDLLGRREHAT